MSGTAVSSTRSSAAHNCVVAAREQPNRACRHTGQHRNKMSVTWGSAQLHGGSAQSKRQHNSVRHSCIKSSRCSTPHNCRQTGLICSCVSAEMHTRRQATLATLPTGSPRPHQELAGRMHVCTMLLLTVCKISQQGTIWSHHCIRSILHFHITDTHDAPHTPSA
jgi:hypothetical protein